MIPRILAAGVATSTGRVRITNEDRHFADLPGGWFAVADGIGGLPFGERASECAVRALSEATRGGPQPAAIESLLPLCHHAVRQLGAALAPRTGIGTTFTVLRLGAEHGELLHVGDSAAFSVTPDATSARRLTREHTSPSPVRIAGGSAVPFIPPPRLDRYLGQKEQPEPDIVRFVPVAGERLILCTDGISNTFEETELALMSRAQPLAQALASALVRIADIRGGRDNATAVVVDFEPA